VSRVTAIAITNLRRFLRDRSNLFFVFIFPLALIFLLGNLFGGGFVPVIGVVVPPDAGPLATELMEDLEQRPGIEIRRYPDQATLVARVERGVVTGGLLIPEGYDQRLERGEPVTLGYLSRPDSAGIQLRSTVAAAVAEQSQSLRAASFAAERAGLPLASAVELANRLSRELPSLEVERRVVGTSAFEGELERYDLGAPSQLVLFTFLTGLTASAALIQSRQLGVSRRMLSTPTSTGEIVAGEALGRLAVTLFQGAYIMAATWLVFGVDWGDPLAAVALLVAFALTGAGAGMLMGSVFSNDQQAGGIGVVLGLGLAALGGSMVPAELFSDTMRRVSMLTPHSWALQGFADLVRRDGGLAEVAPELGVLVVYGGVLLAVAAWRLRVVLTRG
jgi:ABC-2 type transport system permease protein